MSVNRLWARYGQFIRFNLVGVLNTLLDFVIFGLLVWLGFPYLPAQCVSYGAGIANSYLLNKYWTFAANRTSSSKGQAVRFLVLNAATLGLSLILLRLFTERAGLSPLAAKAVVTVFTMLANFAGSKLWVFRGRPAPGGGDSPEGKSTDDSRAGSER